MDQPINLNPASAPAGQTRRVPGPRRLAGFTLVEVLLSSVIMAVVLVSILAVISRTSRYVMDLRVRVRSSQVLQQRIEELRAMSWGQITNLPETFTSTADPDGTYGKFLNVASYQSVNGTTVVVRATAVVTWVNRQNVVVTNSLTTLIGNGGLNKTSL
jgi:Tfp pilus assembly protein PilV